MVIDVSIDGVSFGAFSYSQHTIVFLIISITLVYLLKDHGTHNKFGYQALCDGLHSMGGEISKYKFQPTTTIMNVDIRNTKHYIGCRHS